MNAEDRAILLDKPCPVCGACDTLERRNVCRGDNDEILQYETFCTGCKLARLTVVFHSTSD